MLLDLGVHLRLRVERFVSLVMAEAAVADQVNHDVMLELLAEGKGKAGSVDASFNVVSVDVDDRNVEALGWVRCPTG